MGIESVNIHDAIKVGTPDREKYIANYITTLERLGKADIHVVCYNFMPVFDWTRSDLAKVRPDGATVLAYDRERESTRLIRKICLSLWARSPMDLSFQAGSRSVWQELKSCLKCTRT